MNRKHYIAQAAALQVASVIKNEGHFFCELLPQMDVTHFLKALSKEVDSASTVSLALAGYEVSDADLHDVLNVVGLSVGHVATDLYIAAKWRNEPNVHSKIIALAAGRHPGVNTLSHFPQVDTRIFARALLEWAQNPQEGFAYTSPQRTLLQVLAETASESPLVSLTGVAEFLASWKKEAQAGDESGAARRALPRLGILPDRNLLQAPNKIQDRLERNFTLTQDIRKMSGSRLEQIRQHTKQENRDDRCYRLQVLNGIERLRRISDYETLCKVDYVDAQEVLKPSTAAKPEPDVDEPEQPGVRNAQHVTKDGGELLIDGENGKLEQLTEVFERALNEAVEDDEDSASGHYELNGKEQRFEHPIEREVLTWIQDFCTSSNWGGFFETPSGTLENALRDYRLYSPTPFKPLEQSIAHEGELFDIQTLIKSMQEALHDNHGTTTNLCDLWDRIRDSREAVLKHRDALIHQPMLMVAGHQELRKEVTNLLEAWEQFYRAFAQYHAHMHYIDHSWTQLLFEAITALDVVQIKTNLSDDKISWKAILLPTHPLHLWRYERIATLTRGLRLEGMDRDAVSEQLQKPEHYLGVLYLTSFPEGRGGNQMLPVARDYHGLAVFENLRNAYSGHDGVEALRDCVRQFAQIYVNHVEPLRLALINPPNASHILVTLLARGRGRPRPRATLLVDIYATPDHDARLLDTRRFSTKDRDQIEDYIATGQLQLRVHSQTQSLENRLNLLRERPVHIVAVFDEATTAMRHQPIGLHLLPMSPFAIRRQIAFQGINKKVVLVQTQEESVFRSFYDMVAKLHSGHVNLTPQASADAESMVKYIEATLTHTSPGAFWFFFADRTLPSPGRIRVSRILERHEGRRRAVCYDANLKRLALLLRSPLDGFNLRFSIPGLQDLLKEGVSLLGDNLINLFKADAQPNIARLRGFAGMLIAARDYRSRYPGALVVSVDTKLARLWLRLTESVERCDLLALRNDDEELIVDAIEVKTVGKSNEVAQTDIRKAAKQLTSTLEAIQSGLEEGDNDSPLSAPRQEMLKEVFVTGCQSHITSKSDRERWAKWLMALFRQAENPAKTRLRGTIYAVELSSNDPSRQQRLSEKPYEIVIHRLRETRIQELVSSDWQVPGQDTESQENHVASEPSSRPTTTSTSTIPSPHQARDKDPTLPQSTQSKRRRQGSDVTPKGTAIKQGIRFPVGQSIHSSNPTYYHLHPSNTKLNQLNIGVIGDLGTGKTQLTKTLIYEFTQHAEHNRGHTPKFLIFDYKRDYTKDDFVNAVQARVVPAQNIPLNVFELTASHSHKRAAQLGRVKFLRDAMQKIYGGIGPVQRNYLKNAVMRAYELQDDRAPTLKDVQCTYAESIGKQPDAVYSILSELVDLEVFVDHADEAERFDQFFTGVTVIDLASLGIGEMERSMLLVLFLNLYYEYMINLDKKPYLGNDPQLRFVDSMLLVDEADNIMRYNFEVLRRILLQGREFGVGVLLASQFLSHFKTRELDYTEPLLTWFIHKVPNITSKQLESIGLSGVAQDEVERIKSLDVHQCLYKGLNVPGQFMRGDPFYEVLEQSPPMK